MKIQIPFTKITGAGNDFILIDNREGSFKLQWEKVAEKLCDRHYGIGADGLLVMEPSNQLDFEMKYFNSDGSYGALCGNGGRCAAFYYFLQHSNSDIVHFETLSKLYTAEKTEGAIKLKLTEIKGLPTTHHIFIYNQKRTVYFLDVGSPHIVIFMSDLKTLLGEEVPLALVPVQEIGKIVRNHKAFEPNGANVNFVQIIDTDTIAIRTYERGVEGETLACGTGAVASALVTTHIKNGKSPIHVFPKSKQQLTVHYKQENGTYSEIWLEGPSKVLFNGLCWFNTDSNEILGSPY